MSKEPGEESRKEERLIDFSDLTDEELDKMIEEEEANEEEGEKIPVGKIFYSLITEKLRRETRGEK